MKNHFLQSVFGLLLTAFPLLAIFAQDFPPAQGPSLPPTPPTKIPSFILINMVENTIKTTVDTVNAKIQRDKPNTGVNAKVSFSYTLNKPQMSTTRYKDQPNQNVVWFPFRVTYHVTDISYHGIPYFSRNIFQNIEVYVSCKDWFTDNGVLNVMADIEQPYLDNASFGEQALNFFIANTLTNFVDSKIRTSLPGAMRSSSSIPTAPCNCLGINSGTPAAKYKDGEVLYGLKKSIRPPIGTALNQASVNVLNIKRLNARSFLNNEVLYYPAEDIQVLFYVNNTLRVTQLSQVKEGETRPLNMQSVAFTSPGDAQNIVLIANVEQTQFNATQKDTRYTVYNKSNNFGKGTQKIIVSKSFWEKPRKLPGGGMTKPREVKVDAYELTVQINMPNPEVIIRGN